MTKPQLEAIRKRCAAYKKKAMLGHGVQHSEGDAMALLSYIERLESEAEARDRRVRAEAFEEAAKNMKCMASQLPESQGCGIADGPDVPCPLCMEAARLEGRAAALRGAGEAGA